MGTSKQVFHPPFSFPNWDSETFNNFAEVTQLEIGSAGGWTQASLSPSLDFTPMKGCVALLEEHVIKPRFLLITKLLNLWKPQFPHL